MPKTKGGAQAAAMDKEAEWRAEDDLRVLAAAREIRNDPKRLEAAQALAKKKLLGLAQVAGTDGDSDD